MNRTPPSPPPGDVRPRRRVVAGLATMAAFAAVAAVGPGVALAQAGLSKNHNEVMVTVRR
ncbi:hypothetical protein [Rhodococcus daqingensis]|uniref:Uncharacterized protein n=1 Tax=Rhodococcus daqingensis TaxID=2479363 RepID=A0ABW2RUQ6_9NOCA